MKNVETESVKETHTEKDEAQTVPNNTNDQTKESSGSSLPPQEFDQRLFTPEVLLNDRFKEIHEESFEHFKGMTDLGFLVLYGSDAETSPTGEEIVGLSGKNGLIAMKTREYKRKRKKKNKVPLYNELMDLYQQEKNVRLEIRRLLGFYLRVLNKYTVLEGDEKDNILTHLQTFINYI